MKFPKTGYLFVTTFVTAILTFGVSSDATSSVTEKPHQPVRQHHVQVGFSLGGEIGYESDMDLNKDMRSIRKVGASSVRVDISWALAEPEDGVMDWSRADRVVTAARKAGLKVLGILCFEPDWAVRYDNTGKRLPPDPTLYAQFATAAANRYNHQIRNWEIWNEPNQARFWPSGPDPTAYARLVDAASTAIHHVSKRNMIAVGSMAPAPDAPDGSQVSPETFLETMYDHTTTPSLFDAVSTHPYSYPALPSGNQPWNAFHQILVLRKIMVTHGDGDKPMWLTEYGAPTGSSDRAVSQKRQTRLLTQGLRLAQHKPYVTKMFFYSLRDSGTNLEDVEQNFGVIKYDRQPKKAYQVLKSLLN